MKNDCLVGHLSKVKTGRFSAFYEPVTQTLAPCKLLEKAINQGD